MIQVRIRFCFFFLFFISSLMVKAFDVVAVNPVKQEIAVCGNNQVLYILNSEDLLVKNRISLDFQPAKNNPIFTFTHDGKYLIFQGLNTGLNFFETDNYKFSHRIEAFDKVFINNDKSMIATCQESDGLVRIYSLPQGYTQDEFYYDVKKFGKFLGATFSKNNEGILFCFESLNSVNVKLNQPANWEQMTLFEKTEWERKNDGLNSEFINYNLNTKTWEKSNESWMNTVGRFNMFNFENKIYGVDTRTVFVLDSLNQATILHVDNLPIMHSAIDASYKMLVAIDNIGVTFINLSSNKINGIPFNMQFQMVSSVCLVQNWAYFVTSNFRIAAISTEGGKKGITHVF